MKKIFMTVLYREMYGPVRRSTYLFAVVGGKSAAGGRTGREEEGWDLPSEEDDEVDELGLERDAPRGPRGLDLVDEDQDGREMRQVAEEAEDVHDDAPGRTQLSHAGPRSQRRRRRLGCEVRPRFASLVSPLWPEGARLLRVDCRKSDSADSTWRGEQR